MSSTADPRDAAELVEALEMLQRRRRTDSLQVRPFIADLLAAARTSASDRHASTRFDCSGSDPDGEPVLPRLLDLTEVADRLDVGKRTVERLAASGELPTVRIGSAVRVHSDDLVTYMDALRAGVSTSSTRRISA